MIFIKKYSIFAYLKLKCKRLKTAWFTYDNSVISYANAEETLRASFTTPPHVNVIVIR